MDHRQTPPPPPPGPPSALAPTAPTAPLGAPLPPEALRATARYQRQALSPASQEAYRRAWGDWQAWAVANGIVPLPAAPQAIAAWVSVRADAGRRLASIKVDLNGLRWAHGLAGYPAPMMREGFVANALAGIRRAEAEAGVKEKRAPALLPDHLRAILSVLTTSWEDTRDRALLCVGFAGALRVSELLAIEAAHFRRVEGGMLLLIPHSKTDQYGEGQSILLAQTQDPSICPVVALDGWARVRGLHPGLVFTKPNGGALSRRAVSRIIESRARDAGLAHLKLSCHSMRSGLITTLARAGVPLADIAQQSRHTSEATVARYVREEEGVKVPKFNAAKAGGL